ncbi:MAG: S8 family serine peptidase [Gaiellaceae bacterium]
MNSERGKHGDRNSALWGTGNRGGDSRSNALWGKGGRGAAMLAVAALAMILPIGASAMHSSLQKQGNGSTYISPSLTQFAATHNGGAKISVIIQSSGGVAGATNTYNGLGLGNGLGNLKKLSLVGGVAVTIPANKLDKLAQTSGLIVTPDAPLRQDSLTYSKQLWPYESGNAALWFSDGQYSASMPTIAIVDSGIQSRADFGNRLLASVNLSSDPTNTSLDDQRGHGTFVAGIAAGSSAGFAGAAPSANLVSVKVMDQNGQGYTSDIINACQWILDHKAQYNIKVANFSLHSSIVAPFYYDPLDQAVEKLWFGGVTVVAASGNYGIATGPSGVKFSPGNDPFVITVGAADLGGTVKIGDDSIAPWSAWGYTMDGFRKPELAADGRYMIGPTPAASTLVSQRPDHVVSNDGTNAYMQLSGTSFSTPVVSGTAAQILARHPDWTPDQVKGALMISARPLPGGLQSGGVGETTASKAVRANGMANPNKALEQFVLNAGTSSQSFDSANWIATVQTNASWDSASWDTASWLDASWNTASWLDASWNTASWLDLSYGSASWLDASWVDASWEDAAGGDLSADPTQFTFDPSQTTDLTNDPLLAPDPSVLPPVAPTP